MKDETFWKIANPVLAAIFITAIGDGIYETYKSYHDPIVAYEQATPLDDVEFEPYTHVFYKRYSTSNDLNIEGQVVIPEGYEILEIENFEHSLTRSSETRGFDVWFINNEPVKVSSTYNPDTEQYEYCTPGEVIEIESENMNSNNNTQLVKK